MILLFVMLLSLAVSMAMTPIMMHLAPRLRMVDMPDARKVHGQAIPRVGGVGIVVGSLVAVSLFMANETWLPSYLLAALVLLFFGAADDSLELGHYTKFIGQIIAAVAVVHWGDIWIANLPFLTGELPPSLGKPFTIFALIGIVNAINHSDGLDGLAGGETMMSFACISYLAHLAGATFLVVFCAAVAGGIFGFLRFNTYPARVFMGDAGSQFIGFSLGVALILLTQKANTGLAMALPALIAGLPIVDILVVLGLRIAAGGSWFRATRNHVHHRLLDLGFKHPQVVVVIYALQAILVVSALVCAYESDALVLGIYAVVCGSLFAALAIAERCGWRLPASVAGEAGAEALAVRLHRMALAYVRFTMPAYMLVAGLLIGHASFDLLVVAGVILLAIVARIAFRLRGRSEWLLSRIALYSAAAGIAYLCYGNGAGAGAASWPLLQDIYLASLFVAIALATRFGSASGFVTTPLDILLVIILVGVAALGLRQPEYLGGIRFVLQLAVLFYGCELVAASGDRGRYTSELALLGVSLLLAGKTLVGA